MRSFLTGKVVRRAALFAILAALPGCGGSSGSPTVNLVGNDPNGTPPPTPQQQLITLINQYRTGLGLAPVVEDPIVTGVAQVHTNYMASIGQLTSIMNGQDFTTRLIAAGAPPGPTGTAGAYLARGYSDPQLLFDAMVAQRSIMVGNYSRIGVGLASPGAGNWWTVLFY